MPACLGCGYNQSLSGMKLPSNRPVRPVIFKTVRNFDCFSVTYEKKVQKSLPRKDLTVYICARFEKSPFDSHINAR